MLFTEDCVCRAPKNRPNRRKMHMLCTGENVRVSQDMFNILGLSVPKWTRMQNPNLIAMPRIDETEKGSFAADRTRHHKEIAVSPYAVELLASHTLLATSAATA